jgi:D-alanine--poly(phosphoribitol) ligase subunit 1
MKNDMYLYNLGQLFKQIVEQNSYSIAIKTVDGEIITYSELDKLSDQISHYLLNSGLQKGNVVAILNNKSLTAYAIMIACLKTGVVYTNLDPKSPIERFKKMLNICKPTALFYYSDENDSIANSPDLQVSHKIDYSVLNFANDISNLPTKLPSQNALVNSNNPSYIMFTSGSTGFPKGVLISHANLLNFVQWTKTTYSSTVNDVFTNLNPMHFDNSVFDFYASLFTGASMVPVRENLTINPRKMLDALNKLNPTIWFSVPSLLVYVLNMRALKDDDLPNLRIVTYGGEGFPKNQLRLLWSKWCKRVKFINVYGPTECTCICSSYVVRDSDMKSDNLLPLGPIAPNFYALVLDENNNPVNTGETGELCIGGPNVGLGYYNNPEKTTEVFICNPLIKSHPDIIYKSGDLVTYDEENDLYNFKGRKDNQIKRMGYRIELEEIENALNSLSQIKESAVVFVSTGNKSQILACVCATQSDEKTIHEELKKYLPLYMMPDAFVYFDKLPKNQNGKIDRLKLKSDIENNTIQ